MRVLGIAGSLRRDSYNHALLREAAERLPAGAELVEFDRLGEIPPYDADREEAGAPEPVEALRRAMREADAVLVATPEYNHSIPGVLKNALDWASRPAGQSALTGTPAAVVGAPRPGCSAPSGRRPRPARSSAPSAAAWSSANCRWRERPSCTATAA